MHSENRVAVAFGDSKPAIDRLPSRVRVRRFHARSFRGTVDDDPVGIGLGGQGVDYGTVASKSSARIGNMSAGPG